MQPLPGFRDFLPENCAIRNAIFSSWREVCRRYGFVEWDGPVLEPTDLYKKKSGPEIVSQLFNFKDKGEREVAMRPELTPSLARVIAAHEREFRKPLKWFSIPQCFRYEKQQRGRLREHFQLNCDLIGDSSPAADVEIVALAIDLLRAFGLGTEDVVVRLSDREFWTELLRTHQVAEEKWSEFLQVIDKSEREPREKTEEQLGSLAAPVFQVLESGGSSPKLDAIVRQLELRGLGDFVQVDLSIVRGLAYYTGIVFEIFDRGRQLRAIAGGGRYDNLIAQLSDQAVSLPAIGFAMGDVVLGELLRQKPEASARLAEIVREQSAIDIYLVIAKEERRADALRQLQQLRDAGWKVDYPLAPAKVGKQFQIAEAMGVRIALLYGDEWPAVKVKVLANRHETLVPSDELLPRLAQFLSN
jgi:histidyl-tRNA synthetase